MTLQTGAAPFTQTIGDVVFRRATTAKEALEARQLQARVYAEVGYIDQIPARGVIEDDWSVHADFYIAESQTTGQILGTCRMINWTPDLQVPTAAVFELDPSQIGIGQAAIAGRVREPSALAVDSSSKFRGLVSAGLYRLMWQDDLLRDRADFWLFNTYQRMVDRFKNDFSFPIRQVGEPRDYYNTTVVPIVLPLGPSLVRHLGETNPDLCEWFTEGLSEQLRYG